MANFTAGTSFTDGVTNDVTAAKLNALVADAVPTSNLSLNSTTGTIANFTASTANITLGTIPSLTAGTTTSTAATITTGTIPNLTAGTTTSTAIAITNGTITNGTITNGTIATALIPTLTAGTTIGTAGIFTSGTIATLNSTTGTIATLNSTTGTIATLNSTTGTIATLNSTTGTIATLNSTTGTITNLSTTLAGDFTISSGTGTLGTTGVTAGAYGSVTAIPFLTVDAKGRITSATTGTFSSTPADGSITPSKLSQPLTRATAVNSTSGTAIDFTVIPSWVKRITVILNEVSLSGTSDILVQIGDSGGIENTGYLSTSMTIASGSTPTGIASTAGFILRSSFGTHVNSGLITIVNISGNIWIASHSGKILTSSYIVNCGGGSKTLTDVLDRLRVTTTGSDTFDAGSVNIMYEG